MKEYVIETGTGEKGRSFFGTCVSLVTFGTSDKEIRPVWAMFMGTEGSLKPFMANLRLGKKANGGSYWRKRASDRVEFLKSEGYQVSWQKEAEGVISTIYHPDLFRVDPGMVDPMGIKFILLVPEYWVIQDTAALVAYAETLDTRCPPELLEGLASTAYLFASYLDRRTRCPLIADGRFYMQVLLRALDTGLASFPGTSHTYRGYRQDWGHNSRHEFAADGLTEARIRNAISFQASHADFETFLAAEVASFFRTSI